jgi:hypothetical protein
MRVNNELERIWKKRSLFNLKQYPSICLEELSEDTKNVSQCNCCADRDSKRAHPEYMSGVIT